MKQSRRKNNLGDSSTPDTWAPTSDTIRDERIDAEREQANMTILQKAAEILVECGYGDYKTDNNNYVCWRDPEIDNTMEAVKPFSDTLEGRRQADAIEDWLRINKPFSIWKESGYHCFINKEKGGNYQWRLDRIKWCLQELIK